MGFFSRLFRRSASVPASQDSLWMTAEDFSAATVISPHGVWERFSRRLRRSNGDRSLYEREIRAPRGGGLRGVMKQYNLAAIARDFPGAVSADELSRAREFARDPERFRGTNFHFHPGNDGGEPMPEESTPRPTVPEQYTIAAEVHQEQPPESETELAQEIFRIAPRLERVFEALQGLNQHERRVVLNAALELNKLRALSLLAERS